MTRCPRCIRPLDADYRCPSCGHTMEAAELVGTVLADRYRIDALLGCGGMGAIYEAEQLSIGRTVAIKLIHPHLVEDASVTGRFEREAHAAGSLAHPNCVHIMDFGKTESGRPYIVMERVHGRDLSTVLEEDGKLSTPRVLRVLLQVCQALDEAHARGIVHRDLKPDNIMLTQTPSERDFVKVLDFGIAKILEPTAARSGFQTVAGMVLGTPEFMSPEQTRGKPMDARSDLYSLGVMMHLLIAGELPYTGDSAMGVATRHLLEPVPDARQGRPEADAELCRLAQRLLAKQPECRPQTAMEVHRELEHIWARISMGRGATLGGGRSDDTYRNLSIWPTDDMETRTGGLDLDPTKTTVDKIPMDQTGPSGDAVPDTLAHEGIALAQSGWPRRIGLLSILVALLAVATWQLARPGRPAPAPVATAATQAASQSIPAATHTTTQGSPHAPDLEVTSLPVSPRMALAESRRTRGAPQALEAPRPEARSAASPVDSWLARGRSARQAGRHKDAIRALLVAHDLSPRASLLRDIGLSYLALGSTSRGCVYLGRYVRALPSARQVRAAERLAGHGCTLP